MVISSIQFGGISPFLPLEIFFDLRILGYFTPWDMFGLRSVRTFWHKNQAKKNCQNSQRFGTITSLYMSFSVSKYSNILNIYYSKNN